MTEQLKGLLIETLTYFKNGLDDIETGSEERQPMQDEVDFALELVKKLIIHDVVVPKGTFNCGQESVFGGGRCEEQCDDCVFEYQDN
tara:strand:- start:6119 stop:6379 length:261 start_codon:yes stop_codon:yes gene_type:complete